MLTIFLALLTIICATRTTGWLFERFRQPRVIGEMVAGILLGPTFLGMLAPEAYANIFPSFTLPSLGFISQLGLIIFMFLTGVNFDVDELRRHWREVLFMSSIGIAVPMVLGVALAGHLHSRVSSPNVAFLGFGLFFGIAMSITAFPVLVSILADRGMLKTPIGMLACACAAVNDTIGWIMLSLTLVLVRGQSVTHQVWSTILGPIAFAVGMIVFVRPLLRYAFRHVKPATEKSLALALLFALAASTLTEYLGVHLLCGAFLAGVVMPRRPDLVLFLTQRLEAFTRVLLLPLFFAYTGMRTQIGLVQGREAWILTALVISTAIVGKFGGSTIAARLSGVKWRDSLTFGVLMNTRGLMELIVLNIGLDVGVLSPALYSMMLLMAIATTVATGPALWFLQSPTPSQLPADDAAFSILNGNFIQSERTRPVTKEESH